MPVNLSDWMGAHPWSLWLCLAGLCLVVEVMTPSRRVIGWGAVGAVVGALIAWLLPDLWPLQVVAAALVTGALIVVARDTSVQPR